MTITHHSHDCGDLEDEDGWEAVAELGVLGFVMPESHAEESTEASTGNGYSDEARLGDAPFVMLRLPFVDAVQEERDDVYRCEINQNAI